METWTDRRLICTRCGRDVLYGFPDLAPSPFVCESCGSMVLLNPIPKRLVEEGVCGSVGGDLWFSMQIAEAKRVCAGCPVRDLCLTWAIENGADFGVWGGKSANERRLMRERERRGAA